MGKINVKLTIEHDLVAQAKQKGINISQVSENALREVLDSESVRAANKDCCITCGIPINYPHSTVAKNPECTEFDHYCKEHEKLII